MGLERVVTASPNKVIFDFEFFGDLSTFDLLADDVKKMGLGVMSVVRLSKTLKPGTSLFTDRYFTLKKWLYT